MGFFEAAFDVECPDSKMPERWYLCLMSKYQAYGGPEEGGWYQTMFDIVKYKEFLSEELANEAKAKIEALAEELTAQSQTQHGEYCLNQMEWLDNRGLDADFLP
jgi:hypothetical protein